MKANKYIIALFSLVVSGLVFTSCVDDNEFSIPEIGQVENADLNQLLADIAANTVELKTISEVKALFTSGNNPEEITTDIAVKGYVVSSDQTGNFFEELYIQDAASNPTAGLKIHLGLRSSYNKYNVGREVYIKLKGLYIGETNSGDGIISVGGSIKATDTREIEVISENQLATNVFRSATTETIVPTAVTLGGINDSHIGTFVTVENAYFPQSGSGVNYVDPTQQFDTQRRIEACEGFGFSELLVETSSFATFANNSLPTGGGTISAVVTKDFAGSFTVLVLNTPADVNMNGTRCMPLDITNFPPVFEQDFESTSGVINITGWTNFREAGTESWESYFDTNSSSRAARVGSFRSGDASTISWLITEGINLDNTTQEFLSFETSNSFADGSELEALISTDWDGTTAGIATATWNTLPATIVSDSEFFRNWVHSGYMDLSNYTGTAYIAFKYTGSGDAATDGTFELDNVVINAQ